LLIHFREQKISRPVLVVDFGAQYAQLIARRVREAGVYSEIVHHNVTAAEIQAKNPLAIFFLVVHQVFTNQGLQISMRRFLNLEFQFWEFATAFKRWHNFLVDRWIKPVSASMALQV